MKSPFPGMDPYLETRWRDVHSSLVIYASDAVNRQSPSGLLARSEERTIESDDVEYFREFAPDVSVFEKSPTADLWNAADQGAVAIAEAVELEVGVATLEFRQRFIEIRDSRSGSRVITVIEFVSPTNKRPGVGLDKYRQKQEECLAAGVNLVEIDLTRGGDRSLIMDLSRVPLRYLTTYLGMVRRMSPKKSTKAFRLPLTERLAAIPIPLRPEDKDVLLDLQPLINQVYENGRYGEEIDYREKLEPPLLRQEAEWAASILTPQPQPSAE